ncbi:uncharacterized protein N7477_008858 [Penicillium maclennaniae]|uniref:uncharacterized protein n=1 Tax=Penicillium maclennaniae TaxID=1343394 RepID=UPI00254207A4|nr:uncharacterized protein N7477_008858 [Penicillium maclennaniae]KAJ5666410.1 hypothetical protein N7477_008858 [Penicillium maclennaniae]
MSRYGNTDGAHQTPAIQIDTDTDSSSDPGEVLHELDSDSDGGMQIDQPEPILQIAGSEIEFDAQVMGLEGDESNFTTHAPNPDSISISPRPAGHRPREIYPPARKRIREEDHAALVVLNDWELLVTYAINSRRWEKKNQTIPQTRRFFMAKLIAEDQESEDELYAARFVVPEAKSELLSAVSAGRVPPIHALGDLNENAFLVPGAWKEVLSHDQSGWWAGARRSGAGSGAGVRGQKRSVSGRSSGEKLERCVEGGVRGGVKRSSWGWVAGALGGRGFVIPI